MNEDNVLLLTQGENYEPAEETTLTPVGKAQITKNTDYIPLIAILAIVGRGNIKGAHSPSPFTVNPELSDMLLDIARYMPEERAAGIERASATIDFISRINSPSQISVARNENATPMEIYSTLKRYMPLPMRQTVDMLMTSAYSVKDMKKKSKASDPLDSIINTLSTMRNLKRGLGMAGAAAELFNEIGSTKDKESDSSQTGGPDISKLMELMGTLFTKK